MENLQENSFNETLKVKVKPDPLKFLTIEERKEDILQLYNVLSENYPYFSLKKRSFGYDWLSEKENFIKWAEDCSCNEEFYLVVKKIVQLMQNNHTELLNPLYRQYLGKVYEGKDSWSKVLNHKGVIEKYKAWSEMALPNPYVFKGEFKYIEGKYIYYSKELSEDQKIEGLQEGTILEKISGVSVDKYVASLIDSRYLYYDYKRKKPIAESLRIFTDRAKTMTLGFRDHKDKNFSIKLKSYKYYPHLHSNIKQNKVDEENVKVEIFKEGITAYIKINSFASRHIKPDSSVLEKAFKDFRDYENIVIDVRGNGGGNEEYYMENIVPYIISERKSANFYILFRHGNYIKPFLKDRGFKYMLKDGDLKLTEALPKDITLSKEYRENFGFFLINSRNIKPTKYTGFKGKIFILTDHHTYSAAETFSAYAKATNMGTIVGTTTGGDGVNIDPCVLALKNSGLVVRFAMSMGINADGSINEESHTTPDIYVEQNLKDFMNSEDTVIKYIRNL